MSGTTIAPERLAALMELLRSQGIDEEACIRTFAALSDIELSSGSGVDALNDLFGQFPDAKLVVWVVAHHRTEP